MTDALQPVTVHVPAGRLAEFYQFFGEWLAGDPNTMNQAAADTSSGEDDSGSRIMKH